MHDALSMAKSKIDLKHSATFADTVYRHIKELILNGKLEPNQRITVQEFADYFNVSITPIREAIQRLLTERHLSVNARSEIRVASLSMDDVRKVFELNKAIDMYGIKKNMKNFTNKLIDELEEMNMKLKEYYKNSNQSMYFKQSMEIHHLMWRAYNNDYIYQTLINAQERISVVLGIFADRYYTPIILKKSFKDHCDLLDAIKIKNVRLATKILERHWDKLFGEKS